MCNTLYYFEMFVNLLPRVLLLLQPVCTVLYLLLTSSRHVRTCIIWAHTGTPIRVHLLRDVIKPELWP